MKNITVREKNEGDLFLNLHMYCLIVYEYDTFKLSFYVCLNMAVIFYI